MRPRPVVSRPGLDRDALLALRWPCGCRSGRCWNRPGRSSAGAAGPGTPSPSGVALE